MVQYIRTIYVHFCNGQVQVKYWGNFSWCPKDDFSTAKVYICSSLDNNSSFNTKIAIPYHIHKLLFFNPHLHSVALMLIFLCTSLYWKLLILVEVVEAYSFWKMFRRLSESMSWEFFKWMERRMWPAGHMATYASEYKTVHLSPALINTKSSPDWIIFLISMSFTGFVDSSSIRPGYCKSNQI